MITTKTKSITFLSVLLVLAIFLSLNIISQAKSEPGTANTTNDKQNFFMQKREEVKERVVEKVGERDEILCKNRQNRIDNKINMFGNTERFHRNTFMKIYKRLSNLVARAEENDIDVTILKGNLAVLKTKIDNTETKYNALVEALKTLRAATCNTEEANYKESLEKIKPLLAELKVASEDTKKYFIDSIKPELQKLRVELAKLNAKPERPNSSN